jgi:D-glycero-alpha-D-manno-heptose-7-phosphate kinase
MYINLNRPIVDDLVRVKYSVAETVDHRDQLLHDIAREALRMVDIGRAVEIISIADVPAGTGLGSSSCYAVGLLKALHALKREFIPLQFLAEEACKLEIDILGKPIGKQDQYLAAFGGLTVLEIEKDGEVSVRQARLSESTIDDLNRNMLLFFTAVSRSADSILSEQSKGAQSNTGRVVESLHYIKESGYKILDMLESGNVTEFGLMLDEHWEMKKRMSSKISNPRFDKIYRIAKENGALGGKITGAGGGGFFLFYTEDGHEKLRQAMKRCGLREMRYRFDFEGSKVLVDITEGAYPRDDIGIPEEPIHRLRKVAVN